MRVHPCAGKDIEGDADAEVVALKKFQLVIGKGVKIGLNAVLDAAVFEPGIRKSLVLQPDDVFKIGFRKSRRLASVPDDDVGRRLVRRTLDARVQLSDGDENLLPQRQAHTLTIAELVPFVTVLASEIAKFGSLDHPLASKRVLRVARLHRIPDATAHLHHRWHALPEDGMGLAPRSH
jgi:hypothetical protein